VDLRRVSGKQERSATMKNGDGGEVLTDVGGTAIFTVIIR
jgi:hypothetical protein